MSGFPRSSGVSRYPPLGRQTERCRPGIVPAERRGCWILPERRIYAPRTIRRLFRQRGHAYRKRLRGEHLRKRSFRQENLNGRGSGCHPGDLLDRFPHRAPVGVGYRRVRLLWRLLRAGLPTEEGEDAGSQDKRHDPNQRPPASRVALADGLDRPPEEQEPLTSNRFGGGPFPRSPRGMQPSTSSLAAIAAITSVRVCHQMLGNVNVFLNI